MTGRPKHGEPTVAVGIRLPASLHAWLADAGPTVSAAAVAAIAAQHALVTAPIPVPDDELVRPEAPMLPPAAPPRAGKRNLGLLEHDPPCTHPIGRRLGTGCAACGKDPV